MLKKSIFDSLKSNYNRSKYDTDNNIIITLSQVSIKHCLPLFSSLTNQSSSKRFKCN